MVNVGKYTKEIFELPLPSFSRIPRSNKINHTPFKGAPEESASVARSQWCPSTYAVAHGVNRCLRRARMSQKSW